MPQNPGKNFTKLLLKWHLEQNRRQMPWKGEKDPYKIWLSEIILQQTRVDQGLAYYEEFIKTFPTIQHLARATDEKVFKLWEGLGYYTRCRNLLATARFIVNEKSGEFPNTYENIKALKGIGPYTAAAISSFAFNLPYAVVDGNVFRLLSRLFGIHKPIDSTDGKKYFSILARDLLDKSQPALYNQAIMDFGAIVCKPVAPLCNSCPLNKNCTAFCNRVVDQLPVKEKKVSVKKRWFYYFLLEHKNEIAIQQRLGRDIWQQLFEFPKLESSNVMNQKNVLADAEKKGMLQQGNFSIVDISPLLKQQLSHQLITGQFFAIRLFRKPLHQNWIWVKREKLEQFAFPGIINQYFQLGETHSFYVKVKRAV